MAHRHDIQWNHSNIGFFWDAIEHIPHLNEQYFTKQVGRGLLRAVKKSIPIEGKVLDFGAGRGYLSGLLADNYNVKLNACDFSPASVENIKQGFLNHPNFEAAHQVTKLPLEHFQDNTFDLLFFIETIEHLLPEDYNNTLKELHRLVKPGGHIVVTTPNSEDLEKSKILCPECGAYFHKFQHIRSFDRNELSKDMSRTGFNTISCRATNFWKYEKSIFSKIGISQRLRTLVYDEPHLLYIGQKQ